MEKELKRFSLYIIIFLGSIIYLLYRYIYLVTPTDFDKEILVPLAFSGGTSSLVGLFEIIYSHGKKFFTVLKCLYFIPNKKVYVSISYLLRIKLSGREKYLLVKGKKIDQFQPVGGVYKLVGNKSIEKDWKAQPKADKDNPKDLRFFISAKYIPSVLKWFESGLDREVGVWREFQEELIETGIVNASNFKTIKAEKISTKYKLLNKENRFKDESYHTIIYDTFSLELNQQQSEELNNLLDMNVFNEKYAFVTKEEIEKECFDDSKKRIGQHTKNIL